MTVDVSGLPPKTEFDFFVIQIPNAPFGLAWYQGDIETNHEGRGPPEVHRALQHRDVHRRAASPASQEAPVVHDHAPFPDAPEPGDRADPYVPPGLVVQLAHGRRERGGCPGAVARFNGDHNAGVQALSTRNFPILEGPLRQLTP